MTALSSAWNAQVADASAEAGAEAFIASRKSGNMIKGTEVFQFKKPTYRLKRIAVRPKSSSPRSQEGSITAKSVTDWPGDSKSAEVWKQVGVTIWRLKPQAKGGDGARLLTQESAKGEEADAERVAADTEFKLGEKVRLSIESPTAGYLYIFDREVYADGTFGQPYQIFPTMASRGGENTVGPGRVIDVPGQLDAPFKLDSNDPKWRGEQLTVVVSPTRLAGFGVPKSPARVGDELIAALSDKYTRDLSVYDQTDTVGQPYSAVEKQAGSGTRQLTQPDPYPQTMFKVKARPSEPILFSFSLMAK